MNILKTVVNAYIVIIFLFLLVAIYIATSFPQKSVDELLSQRDMVWKAELNRMDGRSGDYLSIIDHMMEGKTKENIIEMFTNDTLCLIEPVDLEYLYSTNLDVLRDIEFDEVYQLSGFWYFFFFNNGTLVKRIDITSRYSYSESWNAWYIKNRGIKRY